MSLFRLLLRMLRRDLRAGELTLLGLAIVVAVASLTSVGFLADRVAHGLDREANQLLGGDLLLRAHHPWSQRYHAEAQRLGLTTVDTVLFTSMVSTDDDAELAGIKVVAPGYPLRGEMRIAPGPNQPDARAQDVPARGEVWLDERLFAALGVVVGDRIELGLLNFRVAAMLSFESDRGANFFSLLPRAVFNVADLDASGLLVEGSRATWRLHIAGDSAALDRYEAWVNRNLANGESIESIENARPEVRSALDQAQRFLRLAALLAVVLAAVAVGLSARRFMQRHLDGCAVMRCLGATQSQLTRIVVGEFALFGLAAASLGSALGWLVQFGLAASLASIMQTTLPPASMAPLGHGLVVGLALLVGFVLPQLVRLRQVSTLRVLRREIASIEAGSALVWVLGAGVLLTLIVWIAGDWTLGLVVGAGFCAALGVFAAVAWLVLRLCARLKGRGTLRGGGWRYGLAALNRRIGASVIQISALGLGMTALLLLTLVRADLLDNWRAMTPADAPNRFIINIQPDQREGLKAHFAAQGLAPPDVMPMVRGRLVAINGKEVKAEDFTEERAQRLIDHDFNLSYTRVLPDTNRVIAGAWHGTDRTPQFSIEAGLAQTFGLGVGDVVRFEIAGRSVEAPITSVRGLAWDSMRVNFFFIAAAGMLENDPATLVTAYRDDTDAEQRFTAGLVSAFPNLTVIDVGAVIALVQSVTDKLILVVQFVFGFALLAGLVVLYAALQATHDEREFELAMLRTLGARHRQVRQALLAEFVVLGGVAGLLAGAGASVMGWVLAEYVFRFDYVPALWPMVVAVLTGALGVVVGGALGTRALLARSPLASLRAVG
jgi:putative ABC transport system permease protein